MKKKIVGSVLLSVLVAATLAPTAQAAGKAISKSATTKGSIQFKAPDENKPPTDPKDPETGETIDPEGGGGSTTGPLRIDWVTNINFGVSEYSATTQNYYAQFVKDKTAKDKEYPTFIQITDERGGNEGWQLSVANSGAFYEVDKDMGKKPGGKTFEGTTLSLAKPSVKSLSGLTNLKPDTNAVAIGAGNTQAQIVASAAAGNGAGEWWLGIGDKGTKTSGYGPDGTAASGEGTLNATKEGRNPAVKLTIPAGRVIEKDITYATDLVWTIASVN